MKWDAIPHRSMGPYTWVTRAARAPRVHFLPQSDFEGLSLRIAVYRATHTPYKAPDAPYS
eukprot:5742873-Amphidinium_carterae.1